MAVSRGAGTSRNYYTAPFVPVHRTWALGSSLTPPSAQSHSAHRNRNHANNASSSAASRMAGNKNTSSTRLTAASAAAGAAEPRVRDQHTKATQRHTHTSTHILPTALSSCITARVRAGRVCRRLADRLTAALAPAVLLDHQQPTANSSSSDKAAQPLSPHLALACCLCGPTDSINSYSPPPRPATAD